MDSKNEAYVTKHDQDLGLSTATTGIPSGTSIDEQLELFAEILIDQLLSERDGKK